MADFIEFSVMRNGIAETGANRFINFTRTQVILFHQFLHFDQLLWERHIGRQINPRKRNQTSHPLLRKILNATAEILRPLIGGSGGAIVDRRKNQLVYFCSDVSVGIAISSGQTDAH